MHEQATADVVVRTKEARTKSAKTDRFLMSISLGLSIIPDQASVVFTETIVFL
jgi:hypothetical protein